MEQKATPEQIMERIAAAERESADYEEFKQRALEIVLEAFPRKPRPVFQPYATMLFHEFQSAFLLGFCGGVVPRFAQWPVVVETSESGEIAVRFLRSSEWRVESGELEASAEGGSPLATNHSPLGAEEDGRHA